MSRYQHAYHWTFLATTPYHPLLPVGLQGYIPYRHIAAVCRFELVVLPLLVHVKGSTEYITYELVHLCVRTFIIGKTGHFWHIDISMTMNINLKLVSSWFSYWKPSSGYILGIATWNFFDFTHTIIIISLVFHSFEIK